MDNKEDKTPEENKVEADEPVVVSGDVNEEPEEPEKTEHKSGIKLKNPSKWDNFKYWYVNRKKKSIPLTFLVLLLALAAVPVTRYSGAGLVMKNDFSMEITDSYTKTPVSGAEVSIGSVHGTTDADGAVTLKDVGVGHKVAKVTKKYYKDQEVKVLVPISKQKDISKVSFAATGRQVKISVANTIDDEKLANVDIKIAGTTAKTDDTGSAIVVVPIGVTTEKATLSLNGYNTKTAIVQVDNKSVKENNLKLTPVGKVYFLSKLSGKIDVVKTNLDGTGRKTVFAGTGKEENRGTILLATRDWEYLALLSRRDGVNKSLYLINTSNDERSVIDMGITANISPVGWSDHNFIYRLDKSGIPDWKPGKQVLKSYSAEGAKAIMLDQTKGEGKGVTDYRYEQYGNIYQIGPKVIYEKSWTTYIYEPVNPLNKAGIYSINADGSGYQALKEFGYKDNAATFVYSVPYESGKIYYSVTEKGKASYYEYDGSRVIENKEVKDEFEQYYDKDNPRYLLSPSSNKTFWSESRDGKNTLLIGDSEGENGKEIVRLSDYDNYGWYTDDYLLISKNDSELYIIPSSATDEIKPVKITDYHKPTRSFVGYGGGY